MTYGTLITEARQLLQRSAAAPIVLPTADDALAVCHARAKLYRALAAGASQHLHPPVPMRYRTENLLPREVTLLQALRVDLQTAGGTTQHDPTPPPDAAPLPVRLARAADTTGAAFDLLAGQLTTLQRPEQIRAALRNGTTRIAASDTAELTATLAKLDNRLELPLRAAAKPDLHPTITRQILTTAEDCRRTTRQGLREYATILHRALQVPARQPVDHLDTTHATTLDHTTHPAAAAQLVTELRHTASAQPSSLSLNDLAAITAVGTRLGALTACTAQPLGGPTGQALQTGRHWHHVYQHLTAFPTTDHHRQLATYAEQFRAWADPLIHHGDRNTFTSRDWLPAIQSMTTDLAHLADTTLRAINHKAHHGQLLTPFDTRTRGREHLYTPTKPDDPRITRLRHSATQLQTSARQLARDLYQLNPNTHPQPARVPKPPRPPNPTPTKATTTPRPAPGPRLREPRQGGGPRR